MRSVALLAAALAGCAVSSGVQRTGPETFTVSTSASPGRGGVPAAKRAAYEEAAAECKRRSLAVQVIEEASAPPSWTEGMANFSLQFRCAAT